MHLKERIKKLIEEYLQEPEKRKIHHIEISIPGHDGRFWILDAFSLMANTDLPDFRLAIYFSVNQYSKKGRRLVGTIELLDLFEGYLQRNESRFLTYHLVTDNNSSKISQEVSNKVEALFPTLDNSQIMATIYRLDNWVTLE